MGRPRIAITILKTESKKKTKFGGITFSDFKIYYEDAEIKAVILVIEIDNDSMQQRRIEV